MTVSANDAHPYPIYNARFRVTFPILDADGDLVTGATTPDTELSQDSGTFADATNEIVEIATASGMYYIDLIATELDTRSTAIIVKTATAGAKTTPMVLYPRRLPVLRTGTAQAGAASTITLDSGASAVDDYYNGCWVNITNDSPAGVLGQARMITDYVGSTKVATIEGTWGTNPSSASTFEILISEWARLIDPVRGMGSPTALPNAAAEAAGGLYTRGSGAGQINQNVGGQVDTRTVAMAADVVTAAAIAAGAIDAATFAAGAIDAAAIAADAITAAKIAGGAIDAATFAAGAIDAAAIGTGAIDADAIAANAITSAKIATDAIGSAQLAQSAADKIIQSVSGTADSGSTTTIVDAERTEADTDYWKDSIVLMTSGPNVGQVRRISAFNATTDTITVASAFTQAVAAGNTYIILRTSALEAPGAGATDWTAAEKNQIRDALGVDGTKTAATGGQVQNIQADTDNIQTRLPAALVGGRMDSSVGAMAADVVNAAAVADGTITVNVLDAGTYAGITNNIWDELTSEGRAVGSYGQLLKDNVNASIAAVKAKTDQLTFTIANKVDSSIQAAGDFAQAAADKVWSTATRTLTSLGGALVQEIWDRATSLLTTAGSVGKLIVDNLNATVSSRAVPGDAMALTTAERNSIADAHLDRVDAVETGLTPRQALRLALTSLAGKLSGAATTTITMRNAVADTKTRIMATVDADGNRTAITTDVT